MVVVAAEWQGGGGGGEPRGRTERRRVQAEGTKCV